MDGGSSSSEDCLVNVANLSFVDGSTSKVFSEILDSDGGSILFSSPVSFGELI